uniref:Uncharacterized protein n=1 Tax=Glossina palpalis gambiensis TaxID=67801 RepID=A0A1B0BUK0_9MUSC
MHSKMVCYYRRCHKVDSVSDLARPVSGLADQNAVRVKVRPLDSKPFKVLKTEFAFHLDHNIIQLSKRILSNPIRMVPKKSRDWRNRHSRTGFNRFCNWGIVNNPNECEFRLSRTAFLEFHISQHANYKYAKTVINLLRFMSMLYRNFTPKATDCPSSLNAYMEDAVKKEKMQVAETSESEAAFSECKEAA